MSVYKKVVSGGAPGMQVAPQIISGKRTERVWVCSTCDTCSGQVYAYEASSLDVTVVAMCHALCCNRQAVLPYAMCACEMPRPCTRSWPMVSKKVTNSAETWLIHPRG